MAAQVYINYNTFTIEQVIQQTVNLLQMYNDNGQVDTYFIEQRILNFVLPVIKTQETWLPHVCMFPICDKVCQLPVRASDVLEIGLYDSDDVTIAIPSQLYLTNYQTTNNLGQMDLDSGVAGYRAYLSGNTVHFYDDNANGMFLKVMFYAFLRDSVTGEVIIPADYLEAVTKLAASEWLLTTMIKPAMDLGLAYRQQGYNALNLVKGEANRTPGPLRWQIQAMNRVATYSKWGVWDGNRCSRYINNYIR